MSSALHVVRTGHGPTLLFIHGSASDHTAWAIQLASSLRDRFTLIAYDRRHDAMTVEEHAADAASLISPERSLINRPAILVGSSFGSVIALELARARPELCAGAVLIEPPMAASDDETATAASLLDEFDRLTAAQGGPAAGEFFLRSVLGDALFERIPRAFQELAKSKWAAIRADAAALLAYRPRYAELVAVTAPILLVGGDRSVPYFRPTLDALVKALPNARLEIVVGGGHMLHVEAPQRFMELLAAFAGEHGIE